MKKLLFTLIALSFIGAAKAQNLENNIPSNASLVATIKSDKIFKLMPVKDFDQSFLGKKLLNVILKDTNQASLNIEDFGLNLHENSYFFMLPTDSINHLCFYVPLADAQKFEQQLKLQKNEVTNKGNVRTHILDDSLSLIAWDTKKVLFISGSLNYNFFSDKEITARYGMINLDGYFNNIFEVYDEEEMGVTVDTTVVNDQIEPWEDAEDMVEAEEDDYSEYDSLFAINTAIKKNLQLTWMQAEADLIFAGNFSSLNNNSLFKSSLNNKSVVSVWAPDLKRIQSGMGRALPGMTYGGMNPFGGYETLMMDMIMDEKEMRIENKVTLDPSVANSYKKISNRKLNKKFFKYIDSEQAIGFFSTAVNSQAYLEEFPSIMKQTYGSYLGQEYGELIGLGADFMSLILDEKAIGKVAKGDALFVVNGITSKEVTYMGYEYDEDYNGTEVLKTKTETLPSFLFMFSSDDMRLFKKALSIGINKEYVTMENNIYSIKYPKSPMDFYVLMKDGIVFTSNSLEDIQKIDQNQFRSSISKSHQKLLKESNFSFLFNAKNLAKKFPAEGYGTKEQADKIKDMTGSMRDIYIKSNRIKGNIVSGELTVEIPEGQENALKYIFSLVEKMADL